VPGRHNVLNALAAAAAALDLEMPFDRIQAALASFAGVQRRFQIRGEARGVLVVDDYGHHPAEIRATLAAAKAGFDRRVITVFQPHRYSRTQHLLNDFLTAFYQSDVLIVMDIYAAGEAPIPGVHARNLADGIAAHGHREVLYLGGDRAAIVDYLYESTRAGDLVLTLGRATWGCWAGTAHAPRSGPRDDVQEEIDMLGEIRGEVRFKEPLSFHTSLRIGGPADIFIVPQDVEDIRLALSFAEREQLSLDVIGGGNNLLVSDRGVRGVVLKLEGCLGRAEFNGEEAVAGAGVSLSALIREAAALNLGGIECWSACPPRSAAPSP
jgi:hypothetical protein